jgi:hypothetical protein
MARAPLPILDPSRDAAALLRRLGFAVLMLGVPLAALLARRGVVMLVPIGVSLLVLASLLDGQIRPVRQVLGRLAGSLGAVAILVGLVWVAVSLLWAPRPAGGFERLLSVIATLGVAFAGYLALPDRMRSANLYLVPVGAALAAGTAILLAVISGGASEFDEDGQSVGRGLAVIALFAWPSIAWLRSRERDLEAFTLAVLIATATVVVGGRTPLPIALAVGALAYAISSLWPKGGASATGAIMALAVLAAPLLPFLPIPVLTKPVSSAMWGESMQAWRAIIASDPLRLVTGHGFSALVRDRLAGLLPPRTPNSALFQIWYDLGLVGAIAGAAALWSGPRGAVASYAPLLPGIIATFATAFTMAIFGIGTSQMWWLTAITLVVLAFVAAQRGQFRTSRPRALLFGTTREGPAVRARSTSPAGNHRR